MTEGRNIFVCGRTGSGKSYAVKRWLQRDDPDRMIVYQPKVEDLDYPGLVFDAGHEADAVLFRRWLMYADAVCGRWRLVYRPADKFSLAEFDRVCQLVYAAGRCTFVCEEIMTYTSSVDFRRSENGRGFKTLLTAGRTRGVTCWLVTQRPHNIPVEVRSESRMAYLFALHEALDKRAIQETFGSETLWALERLGRYEHVLWDETGTVEVGKA